MAVRLTIIDPYEKGAQHQRGFVQDRIMLGRARSCDVCLPDMAVSTRHAEIRLDGNDYKVVDLGSLNGTKVDGKRLVPHRPKLLRNGDVLDLAGFEISFSLGVTPGHSSQRQESVQQAREMIASLLSRTASPAIAPAIIVLKGPGRASRYELVEEPCVVRMGRARGLEIRLEDRDVSREHAEVVWAQGKVVVRDLGSHNGVLVNGERVEEAVLSPGDTFVLGNTTLAMEHPADGALNAIQEAPEEETSSFTPPQLEEVPLETPAPAENTAEAAVEEEVPSKPHFVEEKPSTPSDVPPVGPEDPLSYPGQPGYVRTTRELPRPEAEEKSDVGLIIVGAIIVVAAVAGLIYLFS